MCVYNDDGCGDNNSNINEIIHRASVVENVQPNRNIRESYLAGEKFYGKTVRRLRMSEAREVEKKIQTVLNQFTAQNE